MTAMEFAPPDWRAGDSPMAATSPTADALFALHKAFDAASYDLRVSLVKFTGCLEMRLSVPQSYLDEYRARCTRLRAIVQQLEQAERAIEHTKIAKEH